jgi:hypothetical protein
VVGLATGLVIGLIGLPDRLAWYKLRALVFFQDGWFSSTSFFTKL